MAGQDKTLAQRLVISAECSFVASATVLILLAVAQHERNIETFTLAWWFTMLLYLIWARAAYTSLRTYRYARRALAETRAGA